MPIQGQKRHRHRHRHRHRQRHSQEICLFRGTCLTLTQPQPHMRADPKYGPTEQFVVPQEVPHAPPRFVGTEALRTVLQAVLLTLLVVPQEVRSAPQRFVGIEALLTLLLPLLLPLLVVPQEVR